jgi:hypothetical protein
MPLLLTCGLSGGIVEVRDVVDELCTLKLEKGTRKDPVLVMRQAWLVSGSRGVGVSAQPLLAPAPHPKGLPTYAKVLDSCGCLSGRVVCGL